MNSWTYTHTYIGGDNSVVALAQIILRTVTIMSTSTDTIQGARTSTLNLTMKNVKTQELAYEPSE